MAGGDTRDARPCWSASKTGPTYKNKSGNAEGITRVSLKSGTGKAKVKVQGRGPGLALPFSITDNTAGTVQLVENTGSGPKCWAVTFPAPAKTYDAVKLRFLDTHRAVPRAQPVKSHCRRSRPARAGRIRA